MALVCRCFTPPLTLLGVQARRNQNVGIAESYGVGIRHPTKFLAKLTEFTAKFEPHCSFSPAFIGKKLALGEPDGWRLSQLGAALGGAALGGFTSFASSLTTLRVQMKAQGNTSTKSRRRKLYKLFIVDASKAYGDALIHDKLELSGLIDLHALVNLMRVNSSAPVIENAVKVVRLITETQGQPNKSPAEIEAMIENGSVDLLRAFSEACRTELETRIWFNSYFRTIKLLSTLTPI